MIPTISRFRIQSAERRVGFVEGQVEHWLLQHSEAEACRECEDFIREMNLVVAGHFELDSDLQRRYFQGDAYSAASGDVIRALFSNWLAGAHRLEKLVEQLESRQFAVEGADSLRSNLREVTACLNPTDELDGEMEHLRDRALVQHSAAQTLEGLVD